LHDAWNMIENKTKWTRTTDEVSAVKDINAAMNAIHNAQVVAYPAKFDMKDDDITTHKERVNKALEYLNQAHSALDEDKDDLNGLEPKVRTDIDNAIGLIKSAIATIK